MNSQSWKLDVTFLFCSVVFFMLLSLPFTTFVALKVTDTYPSRVVCCEGADGSGDEGTSNQTPDTTGGHRVDSATAQPVTPKAAYSDFLRQHRMPQDAADIRLMYISHEWLALFSTAVSFGALGASISVLSRRSSLEQRYGDVTVMAFVIINVVGSVFGLLIFLLFLSSLVQGSLFPSFSNWSGRWTTLWFDMSSWSKLIVWCFLAGFSERLVPNLLDNLMLEQKLRRRTTMLVWEARL